MKQIKIIVFAIFFINFISGFVFSEPGLGLEKNSTSLSSWSLKTKESTKSKNFEYKVGVDDVLEISVIKPQPFSSTVTVAPDGAITFPYIGNVLAKGLTLPEIQNEVQKRLTDGYVEYPIVSVSLLQSRSMKFTISGQVMQPGLYPAEENMTLLRAITVAGGFTQMDSTGTVKLLRPQKTNENFTVIEAEITAILEGAHQNTTILPNDTIIVLTNKFFISGQVLRPGPYQVVNNMTLLQAVTIAGGFTQSDLSGTIKLIRPKIENNNFEIIESGINNILNGADQDIIVQPKDTIVVSSDKYFVYGEVIKPGMLPLESKTTLLTAISQTGGFLNSGPTGKVKILRTNKETDIVGITEIDINDILSGSVKNMAIQPNDTIIVSADKFSISGQVIRPGVYAVEENMTLLQAVSAAGGFIEPGIKKSETFAP